MLNNRSHSLLLLLYIVLDVLPCSAASLPSWILELLSLFDWRMVFSVSPHFSFIHLEPLLLRSLFGELVFIISFGVSLLIINLFLFLIIFLILGLLLGTFAFATR